MGMIGKRRGKVVKGAGSPGADGSDNIGGSLSKSDHWYLQQGFNLKNTTPAIDGHTASGGIITEYVSGSDAYRAHLFEGSGSLVVSSLGQIDSEVDVFLVGGGGGGGVSPPGSSWAAGGS